MLCFLAWFQFTLFVLTRFPLGHAQLPHVVQQPWKPPSPGWLKGNTNGDFDIASRSGGVGVVIRNHDAEVVGGMSLKVTNVHSPEMVEALAGRAACELAISFDVFLQFKIWQVVFMKISQLLLRIFIIAHKLGKLALRVNLIVTWSGSLDSTTCPS